MEKGPSFMKGDVHDEELRSVVAPEGWSNPVPDGRYNLVVLGGGTAGLVCAVGAAGLGAKVALVEKNALGGDCLNTGCVPSKSLLASSHRAKALREASLFGIAGPKTVKVDFSGVMERLRRVRAELAPHDGVERLTDAGVDVFFGEGRFVDADRVAVDGVELLFRRAVIATGGRVLLPNLEGLDTTDYLTSDTIFSLSTRPRRLIVLGGGPVGVEMAQAFSRLGSDVTLVEAGPRLLPRDDPDAVSVLTKTLEADGVRILTNCTAVSVARKGKSCVLRLSRDGQEDDERGDALLVATGRTPTLKGLGLQAAGVRVEGDGGLVLDDFLRTTNPSVFSAGDVASAFQFTHMADAMARIVVQNALFGGRRRVSNLIVPWCTYTDPEVAQVGMTCAQARGEGVAFDLWEEPFSHVDRAVLEGETNGFVRILTARGTDRILGATAVGKQAGELISEMSFCMASRTGLRFLSRVVRPYPTRSAVLSKVSDSVNRARLTPFVAALFRRWLAWTR